MSSGASPHAERISCKCAPHRRRRAAIPETLQNAGALIERHGLKAARFAAMVLATAARWRNTPSMLKIHLASDRERIAAECVDYADVLRALPDVAQAVETERYLAAMPD